MEVQRPEELSGDTKSVDYAGLFRDANVEVSPTSESAEAARSPEQGVNAEAERNFDKQLESLSGIVPEIGEKREKIEAAGREIISAYGIRPDFFDKPERGLLFCALADRWGSTQSSEAVADAKRLNEDLATLLAHKYSDVLGAKFELSKGAKREPTDAETRIAYDKYTDRQLTGEIQEAVVKGILLREVKERLGITPENEDDYEIRVLSIGDEISMYGLLAPRFPLTLPAEQADKDRLKEGHAQTARAVESWREGYKARSADFARLLGRDTVFGNAWITEIDGRKTLCLPSPFAEKLLDGTLTKDAGFFTDADRKREMAIIEHEYTHTQGGLNIDGGVELGISPEELRAEAFSGNRMGYQDIKGLYVDYATLTGVNLAEQILQRTKGGDQVEIYSLIANTTGLSSMLELMALPPLQYLNDEDANPIVKDTVNGLGGYDGFIRRTYESLSASDRSRADERIVAAAETILRVYGENHRFYTSQRRLYELNFMADRYETIIARKLSEGAEV